LPERSGTPLLWFLPSGSFSSRIPPSSVYFSIEFFSAPLPFAHLLTVQPPRAPLSQCQRPGFLRLFYQRSIFLLSKVAPHKMAWALWAVLSRSRRARVLDSRHHRRLFLRLTFPDRRRTRGIAMLASRMLSRTGGELRSGKSGRLHTPFGPHTKWRQLKSLSKGGVEIDEISRQIRAVGSFIWSS
jgi:hypothetical protein